MPGRVVSAEFAQSFAHRNRRITRTVATADRGDMLAVFGSNMADFQGSNDPPLARLIIGVIRIVIRRLPTLHPATLAN